MKTICIKSLDDSTFSVYEEAEEGMEGMEAAPGATAAPMAGMPEVESDSTQEEPEQPAATLDEALEIARGMLGGEQAAGKSPEELFQGGFQKARGLPAGM